MLSNEPKTFFPISRLYIPTVKTLLCFERCREFFGNGLPVFDITEQTVLVQAIYVKRSAGDLYTFPIAINSHYRKVPIITIAHWQLIHHIISL